MVRILLIFGLGYVAGRMQATGEPFGTALANGVKSLTAAGQQAAAQAQAAAAAPTAAPGPIAVQGLRGLRGGLGLVAVGGGVRTVEPSWREDYYGSR